MLVDRFMGIIGIKGVILFTALLSYNVVAGDLTDLVQNVAKAEQQQNYQGVFILRDNTKISTMRVNHGIGKNGIWESLEALNGEPKEIIRHNNRVVSITPATQNQGTRYGTKKRALHRISLKNIAQLEKNYLIKTRGFDRIANYLTQVIDIRAKDNYRYAYRYWIDNKTGLLLRCDLISEQQEIIEQMMFTTLSYLSNEPASLANLMVENNNISNNPIKNNSLQESKLSPIKKLKTTVNPTSHQWLVSDLPDGFRLTHNNYPRETHSNKPMPKKTHLLYSDGLASVSVFIETVEKNHQYPTGTSTMGAVNVYSYINDNHFITAVGEVPKKTVQLMAKSVTKIP